MFSINKANYKRKRVINPCNSLQCSQECDYLATGIYEKQYTYRCVLPSIQKGELQTPKGVFLQYFAKYPERCQYCLNQKSISNKNKKIS